MSAAIHPSGKSWFSLQSLASQGLALVPLLVALTFGALVLPRSVAPDEVPQPTIDARSLAATLADDTARAARARRTPLPARVRAVGSAYRDFNTAEAGHGEEAALSQAHEAIFHALRQTSDADIDDLRTLRAVEADGFITEVHRFESTGDVSDELLALGGTFLERMKLVGWCVDRRLSMTEPVLRAAFKLTWNRELEVDKDARFALSVDELRALYGFYFAHPRGGAAIAKAQHVDEAARKAIGSWLLGKIDELSRIDAAYPVALARASVLYMERDYHTSALLYEGWLEAHPNGAWTLRVKNHLRAALLAQDRVFP